MIDLDKATAGLGDILFVNENETASLDSTELKSMATIVDTALTGLEQNLGDFLINVMTLAKSKQVIAYIANLRAAE